MRSTGESAEGCYRKGRDRSVNLKPDSVADGPMWVMVEAGKKGTVSDMFAPALDRLYRAIERDIRNVSKN